MTTTQNLINKIKESRFFRDSSWAVIGSGVSKAAAMVVGIIIARLLGVEAFGEYGMVKSTLFYIAVFSTFGLFVDGLEKFDEYHQKGYIDRVVSCT